MFNTQTTDYKITDTSCLFHTSPYADITRILYDELRKRGMAISVYFSKPDWHSDAYWHHALGPARHKGRELFHKRGTETPGTALWTIPTASWRNWEPGMGK